ERAASPSTTEVSVDLIVREMGRLWGSGRGRKVAVRFDGPNPDGVVTTDPYVVGPLLALLIAWVDARGGQTVAVRARSEPEQATFVVEPAGATDAARTAVEVRILSCVPPTEQVARRVADQIGATLQWGEARGSIALPTTPG